MNKKLPFTKEIRPVKTHMRLNISYKTNKVASVGQGMLVIVLPVPGEGILLICPTAEHCSWQNALIQLCLRIGLWEKYYKPPFDVMHYFSSDVGFTNTVRFSGWSTECKLCNELQSKSPLCTKGILTYKHPGINMTYRLFSYIFAESRRYGILKLLSVCRYHSASCQATVRWHKDDAGQENR